MHCQAIEPRLVIRCVLRTNEGAHDQPSCVPMHRQSPRSLRNRSTGVAVAESIVLKVRDAWQGGMPTRLVRKILRKKGIHPWSLLNTLEGLDWVQMVQELRVPRWMVDACLDPCQAPYENGMAFRDLPDGARLPQGLVLPHLCIMSTPRLQCLPRRTWTWNLTLHN